MFTNSLAVLSSNMACPDLSFSKPEEGEELQKKVKNCSHWMCGCDSAGTRATMLLTGKSTHWG